VVILSAAKNLGSFYTSPHSTNPYQLIPSPLVGEGVGEGAIIPIASAAKQSNPPRKSEAGGSGGGRAGG